MGYIPWINQICNNMFSSSGRLAYLLNRGGYIRTVPCPKCGGSDGGYVTATGTPEELRNNTKSIIGRYLL